MTLAVCEFLVPSSIVIMDEVSGLNESRGLGRSNKSCGVEPHLSAHREASVVACGRSTAQCSAPMAVKTVCTVSGLLNRSNRLLGLRLIVVG